MSYLSLLFCILVASVNRDLESFGVWFVANEGFFPTPGYFPFLLKCVRNETLEANNMYCKRHIYYIHSLD